MTDTDITKNATKAVNKLRRYVLIGIVAVLLLVVAPLVYAGVSLYSFDSEDNLTSWIVSKVPYPVAIVNGEWINYQEFKDNFVNAQKTADQFAEDEFFIEQVGAIPTSSELAQLELDRMIDAVVLDQAATKAGLNITQEDIDTGYQDYVLADSGVDESTVEETLEELYGWTLDEFKEQVIRDVVTREKLLEYLMDNDKENFTASARADIDAIAEQVAEEPDAFADFAQTYSEDGSASVGGELGFFERGVMVEEFETAAFGLTEPNQISEVVESEFGFHIIQLIERKEATDDDAEQVNVRHILIRFSIDDYLEELRKEGSIKTLIDVTAL